MEVLGFATTQMNIENTTLGKKKQHKMINAA